MKCTYKITDKALGFSSSKKFSEEELIEELTKLLTDNPEMFSDIMSSVFKADTVVEKLDSIMEAGKRARASYSTKESIGVNKYIEMPFGPGEAGLAQPLLTPEYRKDERIKNYIKLERERRSTAVSDTELENEIINKIEDEKLNTEIGIQFHALIAARINNPEDPTESEEYKNVLSELRSKLSADGNKLFNLVTEHASSVPSMDEVISHLETQAEEMVARIYAKYPRAKKIYSEMPMSLGDSSVKFPVAAGEDVKNLFGIADLIIVNEDDTVEILDFKVCNRAFDDWYAAKVNHTDYQLGMYRAMLMANGVPNSNRHPIGLKVAPVIYPSGDIMRMSVDLFRDRLTPDIHGHNRLDAYTGEFTYNINQRIKSGFSYRVLDEDVNLLENIENSFEKIIGQHDDIKEIDINVMMDSDHLRSVVNESGVRVWEFFDAVAGKNLQFATEEEAKEEIKEYVKRLNSERNKSIEYIQKSFEEYKEKGTPIAQQEYLKSFGSRNRYIAESLQKVFGKYAKEGWDLVKEIPALDALGILVFKSPVNPRTGKSTLEIVSMTHRSLNTMVSINGRDFILSKYYSDEEIHGMDFPVLDSSIKNLKIMEVLAAVNECVLAAEEGSSFASCRISDIVVFNPILGENSVGDIDLDACKSNFDKLCTKAGITNKFNDVLLTSNMEETLLQRLMEILHGDDELASVLKDIDDVPVSLAEKRSKIEKMLLLMRNKRPYLKRPISQAASFNEDNPWDMAYVILSNMNNYYAGVNVHFDGRYSDYNISFHELLRILGLPFTKGYAKNLPSGINATGFLNGLYTTSPQTSPSGIIRQLSEAYDRAFLAVRNLYDSCHNKLGKITTAYMRTQRSTAYRLFANENTPVWEKFILKDPDGKWDPNFRLVNPWSKEQTKHLTPTDIKFLKNILWEMNKWKLTLEDTDWALKEKTFEEAESDILLNASVQQAIHDLSYFQIPLRRANTIQKLRTMNQSGIKQFFLSELQQLKDNYDPRELVSTRAKQLKGHDPVDMYNNYNMTQRERMELLEKEGVAAFSIDLDFIAHDVAFQNIRKSYFDRVLLLTDTVATSIKYICQNNANTDMQKLLDTIEDQAKISLTGEPIVNEEVRDVLKGVGFLQKINSFIVLALRPFTFFKELIVGQITNYSRAFAYKGTAMEISAQNVFDANKVIWGQSGRKYLYAISERGDITDFTLVERLNRLYGIANEDTNRIVDNTTLQRTGVSNRLLYISNSAPDYYNRMGLFIAKMMKDGCYEAHDFDANGELVYDWKKDKRFSLLAKHGLNSDNESEEYKKQKALYVAILEDEEKTYPDHVLRKWNKTTGKMEYGNISQAYSIQERNAIKEVADLAYGFYDHESKSLIMHTFIGKLFLQFQTFMTAKFRLYFGNNPRQKGTNTSQGKWVPMKQDGKLLYRKPRIDADGNILGIDLVTEDTLSLEERAKYDIQVKWEGDAVEGIIYSVGGLLYDILHFDLKNCFKNPARVVNLKIALNDLLVGLILMQIIKLFFSGGTGRTLNMNPLERTVYRATRDIGPNGFMDMSMTPSFISTYSSVKRDVGKLFSDSEVDLSKMINKRFGFLRDFYWEDPE